jgi:lipopolysaccharide biosynthesis regulator YciM
MDEITLNIWGVEVSILVLLATVVILGVAGGYFLGRYRSRRSALLQTPNPPESYSAFLEGIHYILANETDQAIEALSRAVQINSETIETYVALGNLFRAKGEIDRAIRIRQSILLRQKVDPEIKLQALFDLGLDYKQGGFLQRSIYTFEEVINRAPRKLEAYVELEELYELTRDWQRAYELQREICKLSNRNEQNILAHLQTEHAKDEMKDDHLDNAKSLLKKALSMDSRCVDAQLQLGELYWMKNKKNKALRIWKELIRNSPEWSHLVLVRMEERDQGSDSEARLLEFFETVAKEELSALAFLALARCFIKRNRKEQGFEALRRALEVDPDLHEARRILGESLLEDGNTEIALSAYAELLGHLQPVAKLYFCQHCGIAMDEIHWKCPSCQRWDTVRPRTATGNS